MSPAPYGDPGASGPNHWVAGGGATAMYYDASAPLTKIQAAARGGGAPFGGQNGRGYAGAGNGSYETKYLRLLDKYVNSKFLGDCQILYRPHPWRGALGVGEKDFLSQKWDNIVMDPSMHDYYKNEINTILIAITQISRSKKLEIFKINNKFS